LIRKIDQMFSLLFFSFFGKVMLLSGKAGLDRRERTGLAKTDVVKRNQSEGKPD
jgi:hypothetical protein